VLRPLSHPLLSVLETAALLGFTPRRLSAATLKRNLFAFVATLWYAVFSRRTIMRSGL
jgi:hypothetical protein